MSLDDAALLRYSRHILLDDIGIEGQTRLIDSHVLIVGAGGLGCPSALYLAAAGVGKLTIIDPDQVELSNLQRQILYDASQLQQAKATAAAARLHTLNPLTIVNPIVGRADAVSLPRLVAAADLVLDCSDNFSTRYAVNRHCVQATKPLISGAASRYEGQLAVFDSRQKHSPCYHCLFPQDELADPSPDALQTCANSGVFAPLTGMIGAMQAGEALKLLGGFGEPFLEKLLLIDAGSLRIRTLPMRRDPLCAVCNSTAELLS